MTQTSSALSAIQRRSGGSAIIIGAGIVGLATARALALRGYNVTIFERNERAMGASIRNFGMVWPIGQATGPLFERAMLSRSIWKEICTEANIWHNEVGSLHLAYHDDELQVIKEYVEVNHNHRDCALLTAQQALEKSHRPNILPAGWCIWQGCALPCLRYHQSRHNRKT